MPNVFWPYGRRAAVMLTVATWTALGTVLAIVARRSSALRDHAMIVSSRWRALPEGV